MKHSNAVQASLLLALIAGSSVTEAARERIVVRNYGIRFKVDWWDDGRVLPYRVRFRKKGVASRYVFDAGGRLRLLYVDDAAYQFTIIVQAGGEAVDVQALSSSSDRMLSTPNGADVDHHRRRLYDCSDCEETWDTICEVGLADVCYWVGKAEDVFTADTQKSIRRMCNWFGKECTTSAETTCDGICIEGGAFDFRGRKRVPQQGCVFNPGRLGTVSIPLCCATKSNGIGYTRRNTTLFKMNDCDDMRSLSPTSRRYTASHL